MITYEFLLSQGLKEKAPFEAGIDLLSTVECRIFNYDADYAYVSDDEHRVIVPSNCSPRALYLFRDVDEEVYYHLILDESEEQVTEFIKADYDTLFRLAHTRNDSLKQ